MKAAMLAPALSAGEASLEEGPALAILGSRPPSPMLSSTSSQRLPSPSWERDLRRSQYLTGGTWNREANVSASVSREASSERRASSPATREALMRTRGILATARTRVVELESQVVKLQQDRSAQDMLHRDLQEQVRSLQAQMLERVLDARRSPRKSTEMTTPSTVKRRRHRGQEDICSDWCSPLPFASPLQVCEAAVARLEGLFERSSVLRSHLLEWRVRTLEARRHRGLAPSNSAYFDEFQAKTCIAGSCSEIAIGDSAGHVHADNQPPLRNRQRRRLCPGTLRLVAATTNRRETASVLLVWTAWWSLWRGRHLKARAMCEVPVSPDPSRHHLRWQCLGCSNALVGLCLSVWAKKASDECRSRLRALACQLQSCVDSQSSLVARGRRLVSSIAALRADDALQMAWTRWRETVEANAYFRRASAAHASRCESLRSAATVLAESSNHKQQACLLIRTWLAWRNLCRCQALRIRIANCKRPDMVSQRASFQAWLIATKAAFADRFRVSHASHVRRSSAANQVLIAAWSSCERDLLRTCLGPWRSCTLLTRQGQLHRRQLLEVLAPKCALVRMCLAVWNRCTCDSRMYAWRIEQEQAAEVRCQALETLSTLMVRSSEATINLLLLAWSSWRRLQAERLSISRREDANLENRVLDPEGGLQNRHREALSSLRALFWRDLDLAMATIAWKAWYMVARTSGPKYSSKSNEGEPSGLNSSPASERRQSPFKSPLKRAVTRQANINGRPPSAAASSLIGVRQPVFPSRSLQIQTPSKITLAAVQQLSEQASKEEGTMPVMRHVRSDPSICMKPPSCSPDSQQCSQPPPSPPYAVTALGNRLSVAMASLSVTAPASSRSSASTAASTRSDGDFRPEWNSLKRPSLASFVESTSLWHSKQVGRLPGGSVVTSEGGPSTSDRSNCCSTPRSVGGTASGTGSSPEQKALGPPCMLLETPLPQSKGVNAHDCQGDAVQTPVGPLVTPSPRGVAGRTLHRSASSLVASDLIRPMARSNSSQLLRDLSSHPR